MFIIERKTVNTVAIPILGVGIAFLIVGVAHLIVKESIVSSKLWVDVEEVWHYVVVGFSCVVAGTFIILPAMFLLFLVNAGRSAKYEYTKRSINQGVASEHDAFESSPFEDSGIDFTTFATGDSFRSSGNEFEQEDVPDYDTLEDEAKEYFDGL